MEPAAEATTKKRARGGEDRLSALPDCLLHDIMSSLKARQAVQTCVLSTRWRHLWRSVPCLDVDLDEFTADVAVAPDAAPDHNHAGSGSGDAISNIMAISEFINHSSDEDDSGGDGISGSEHEHDDYSSNSDDDDISSNSDSSSSEEDDDSSESSSCCSYSEEYEDFCSE